MGTQELLVALALMAALAYLGRRGWRAWRGRSGCGGCGSGCASTKSQQGAQTLIPSEQLTLRARGRR
jgi:hypothetical protein